MPMKLEPCDTCDRWTYNGKNPQGDRLCDPCRDSLAYIKQAALDDLCDLIGGAPA